MVSRLSLEAVSSLRVVTVTLRASGSAWSQGVSPVKGVSHIGPLVRGRARTRGQGSEWAALSRRGQLESELREPAGHLFLNDKGSQELLVSPHSSCPHRLPVTFWLFRTTGQVALNQAIYMLMWKEGLRRSSGKTHYSKGSWRKGVNRAEAGGSRVAFIKSPSFSLQACLLRGWNIAVPSPSCPRSQLCLQHLPQPRSAFLSFPPFPEGPAGSL